MQRLSRWHGEIAMCHEGCFLEPHLWHFAILPTSARNSWVSSGTGCWCGRNFRMPPG